MITPTVFEGSVGDSLELQCPEADDVLWFYEKFKYHPVSPPIWSGHSFKIDDSQSKDSGTYFCYGQYLTNGSHFLAKSVVKIYGKYVW